MIAVIGKRWDGSSLGDLGEIASLSLQGSLSSPATNATLKIVPQHRQITVHSIQVLYEERELFSGTVDFQRERIDDSGHTLHLEGRSTGGLLLDNEAPPGNLWGATLSSVFARHIAPYGFLLRQSQRGRRLPQFVIPKGMSEWEVFLRCTQRLYGTTPFVLGQQVYTEKREWSERFVLSNTGEGIPYTALEECFVPYHMLSSVSVRNAEGEYTTTVRSHTAQRQGVLRRRYHIPTTEYIDHPRLTAHQRIQKGLYQSRLWKVTLPQILPVQVGDGVSLVDRHLTKRGLIVHSFEHTASANGFFTTLVLRENQYR